MSADDRTVTVVREWVEKYLKGLLVLHGADFPKTHDVGVLLRLLPKPLDAAISPADHRRLTEYATAARYPGETPPIPLKEARQAVRLARSIRSEVRRRLPRTVLRKRR
jgi:HEPN domain-containing protein